MVASDWAFWRRRASFASALGGGGARGRLRADGPRVAGDGAGVPPLPRGPRAAGRVDSGRSRGGASLIAGAARPSVFSYGSFNLDGALPDALAKIPVPLTLAAIAALAARELRAEGPGDEFARIERITCAAVAATAVLWLGGKVFSPQYLTWGIPLVLAIPGSRGVRASRIALVALVLTQVYHRGFYTS